MPKQIVVVVGAGASAEFRLPVGKALQSEISALLNVKFDDWGEKQIAGDRHIFDVVRRDAPSDAIAYQNACWLIRDGVGLTDSIDNFMDKHQTNTHVRRLGQLAIAKAIATAENRSSLFVDPSNSRNNLRFDQTQDTWLVALFKHLQRRNKKENVDQFFANVSFVVFNYDRCVEHFMLWALRASYGISETEAAVLVGKADILHPYGTIGRLPWWTNNDDRPIYGFGWKDMPIAKMSEGIRTYTDQIADETFLNKVRTRISGADLLCFLGFSYLPQNMDLLTPEDGSKAPLVIGSSFAISPFNVGIIEKDLTKRLGKLNSREIYLPNVTCHDLVNQFGRAFD